MGLLGIALFLGIALLLSEQRNTISIKTSAWCIGLQFAIVLLILKTNVGLILFQLAQKAMTTLLNFSQQGASFMFGQLPTNPQIGAFMAFSVLPIIIFMSSFMAILYHLRITPILIQGIAKLMKKTLHITGLEAVVSSLLIFMGIEAITVAQDQLKHISRSELFTIMTVFVSTIAGSVMAVYVQFGAQTGHLLAASIMSAPAAILFAKIIVPETRSTHTDNTISLSSPYHNLIEAAAEGAQQGMQLVLNIGAMLIAFISLVALINAPLSWLDLSLEKLLGYLFTPIAILIGIPLAEAPVVGELMGIKVVLTEFLSYAQFHKLSTQGLLSQRSLDITTYALCGFTSIASLAILIGGFGSLIPKHKPLVIQLAFKALLAGLLANWTTAAIVSFIV